MRISKERLKQIIKEETQKIISEAPARRTRGSLGNPTAGGNWWDPLNIAGGGTTPRLEILSDSLMKIRMRMRPEQQQKLKRQH